MLPLLGTQGYWELVQLSEQESEELAGISVGEARCGMLSSDSKTPLVIGSSGVEGASEVIIEESSAYATASCNFQAVSNDTACYFD